LDQLLGFFRDIMAAAAGCGPPQFLYTARGQADQVIEWGHQLGVEKVLALVQILEQATVRFRTTVHSRTVLEVALVRICNLDQLDQLPDLIAELRAGAGHAAAADRAAASGPPVAAQPAAPGHNPQPPSETRIPQHGPAGTADPAPAAPAPGTTTTLRPETALTVWAEALRRLATRAELVADQAALCQLVQAPELGHLVVDFAVQYTSCKSFCEQPQQRAKLEQALAEVAGRPVRLEFRLGAEPGPGADSEPPSRGPSRRQQQSKVVRRPLVRRAMELFDAGPPKVEPPGGSR
jgi:DNA polymerase-3 subunit gamma/tau